MTSNTLNMMHYHWEVRYSGLGLGYGVSSRVRYILDKNYQEERQVIMTINISYEFRS